VPSTQRDATTGLDPTLMHSAMLRETPDVPRVELRTSSLGDWIAIYVDGEKKADGHSLHPREILAAVGITPSEQEMPLDDMGMTPDGSDPFPETLS
jgi:hypothetical protein